MYIAYPISRGFTVCEAPFGGGSSFICVWSVCVYVSVSISVIVSFFRPTPMSQWAPPQVVELWGSMAVGHSGTRTAGQLGGSTLTSIFNIHDRNGGGGEFMTVDGGGVGHSRVFEWQSKIMAITAEYCKLFALATSLSTHIHTHIYKRWKIHNSMCANIPTCTLQLLFNNSVCLMQIERLADVSRQSKMIN